MHEKGGEVIIVIDTITIIIKMNQEIINGITMKGLCAADLECDGGGRGALHL